MKNRKMLLLSALCAALPTVQTKCAAEVNPTPLMAPAISEAFHLDESLQELNAQDQNGQKLSTQTVKFVQAVDIFDVDDFVEKVENEELTDAQILPNLERQNPLRGRRKNRRRVPGQNMEQDAKPYITERPIIRAIDNQQLNALATFIRLGANLETPEERGFTPLILAVDTTENVLNMLLEAKANVNAQGRDGWTPLIYAAKFKKLESAKALIAAKAELDMQDDFGQTALIDAIRPCSGPPNPQIVRALLEAKANPTIVDAYGKTAIVYAQREWDYLEIGEITALLVAAGAHPEQKVAPVKAQVDPNAYKFSLLASALSVTRLDYLDPADSGGTTASGCRCAVAANAQAAAKKEEEEEEWGCMLM